MDKDTAAGEASAHDGSAHEFAVILASGSDGRGVESSTGKAPTSVFDFVDRPAPVRPRTTAIGWIALAASVLVPPAGLVLGVTARSIFRRRFGRSTWPVALAIVLSVTLTVVLLIGALIVGMVANAAAARQAVVDDSAGFCAEIARTPGVLERSGFGWPTEANSFAGSIAAMKEFEDRWAGIAEDAPAPIRADATAIARASAVLIAADQSSQAVDRQADLDAISTVTDDSSLPAWAAEYCG